MHLFYLAQVSLNYDVGTSVLLEIQMSKKVVDYV